MCVCDVCGARTKWVGFLFGFLSAEDKQNQNGGWVFFWEVNRVPGVPMSKRKWWHYLK